jgi:hypothetical protein
VWEERRDAHRVLVEKSEGKRHLDDPGVDGSIIIINGGMDWIGRAQNRDRWRDLVNEVGNLRFP